MNPNTELILRLCCAPTLALAMQAMPVHAEMLGPEKALPAAAQGQAEVERAKVQQFLDRASVREQLQALGVDAMHAGDRVKAMTDDEVHALAQRVDTLPAGGALSESDIILILLVAILILVAI